MKHRWYRDFLAPTHTCKLCDRVICENSPNPPDDCKPNTYGLKILEEERKRELDFYSFGT